MSLEHNIQPQDEEFFAKLKAYLDAAAQEAGGKKAVAIVKFEHLIGGGKQTRPYRTLYDGHCVTGEEWEDCAPPDGVGRLVPKLR
jgi:hypothetical protein